ncbi:MAG TPA: MFS transporter [Dehalococcoidia bacterium]|nr:MFS transporter [Dehalococcoidia bacterium]
MTIVKRLKPRYFYGWNIVGASFLAHLSYAEHHSSMLGFFFKPLGSEFGWSRSSIAAVQTIARVTEALIAPVIGPLIDKYGARVLMPVGAVIVGLSMLGVTQVSTLWQFYLFRGIVVAIGFTLMGALVTDVAINNWFVRRRGRAIAFARLGSNLSNIIFVPVTVFVIASSGWHTMFVVFAVVTWLVVLVPSVIFMRRRPEDMGLHPDGDTPVDDRMQNGEEKPSGMYTTPGEPVWNRREVLTTGSFWLLAASLGISSMAFQGINISLAAYIQDLHYDNTTLAAVMTVRAVIMAAVLPFMGLVAEHAHRVSVRVIPFIIQGLGAFLFLLAGQPVFLWLAVAVYGIGMSGIGVIQGIIWANYFGRFSLGLVRSMGFFVAFGFGAAGPVAMNAVFDITGSYRPAFIVITGLFAAAAFLIGVARPPRPHRYTTADGMTVSSAEILLEE